MKDKWKSKWRPPPS